MEKITKFFIENRIFANTVLILTFGLGVWHMLNARKEGFPNISFNRLSKCKMTCQ